MGKVNLLLVDDQPGNILTIRGMLVELGENLVLARSGSEALQYLAKEECSLLVVDVDMPEMNGYELAEKVRHHSRSRSVPIIFMSPTVVSEADLLRGYKLGAVDFIVGPVVPEILRAKVAFLVALDREWLAMSKSNSELKSELSVGRQAQEQILQMERLAAIGQMVAGLAHESRNALQQIQASVEMLMRRLRERDEVSLVLEIQRAHDRIHDLFDAVRTYAGPISLDFKNLDLSEIWRRAWDQLAPQRQRREIELREDTSAADLHCHVDAFSTERLFRFIFENSLTACPNPGQIVISCSASHVDDKPAVRIRITDNGPGLTPEQRLRIFDPFYTTKTNGTGLGMAIAKRIAIAQGGRISVGEASTRGTTIDVFLPKGPT